MQRIFKVKGRRVVLDIIPGSEAAKAGIKFFKEFFETDQVKELED